MHVYNIFIQNKEESEQLDNKAGEDDDKPSPDETEDPDTTQDDKMEVETADNAEQPENDEQAEKEDENLPKNNEDIDKGEFVDFSLVFYMRI